MVKVEGRRFLVTGGAGFIGSHICEELIAQGKEVICLDNYETGSEANVAHLKDKGTFRLFNADVSHAVGEYAHLFEGVDVVFHNAAAKCTVCRKDPKKDMEVNVWGAYNVAEASRQNGVKKIVHASTGSVYGDLTKQFLNEDHPLNPKSFYGVSKLAGEKYLRAFSEYYGMEYSVIRYFHVYGSRQNNEPDGGVIPIFIRHLYNGTPIEVFGDGEQVRLFTHVDDDVEANFLLANKGDNGEAYNSCCAAPVSLNQLIAMLEDIMDRSTEVRHLDARLGDIKKFKVSTSKIAKLGKKDWIPFKEGLERLVEWEWGRLNANR